MLHNVLSLYKYVVRWVYVSTLAKVYNVARAMTLKHAARDLVWWFEMASLLYFICKSNWDLYI